MFANQLFSCSVPSVVSLQHIVTHPGQAHRDEFLACAFILAKCPSLRIFRREPELYELAVPSVIVIDVGGRSEPELSNFDHHQLPRDAAPTCALHLVLDAMGLLDFAKEVLPWLQFTAVLDSKGPNKAAEFLGMPRDRMIDSISPVEEYVLKEFSSGHIIRPDDLAHTLCLNVGCMYTDYLNKVRDRLVTLTTCDRFVVHGVEILDATPISAADEPTLGIELWCKKHAPQLGVTITQDDRGPGFALYRRDDHPQVDFSRLAGDSRVIFAHPSGFIAKTELLTNRDLLDVLSKAIDLSADAKAELAAGQPILQFAMDSVPFEAAEKDAVLSRPDRFEQT